MVEVIERHIVILQYLYPRDICQVRSRFMYDKI